MTNEEYQKRKQCLHLKHRTPESRADGVCPEISYLRILGYLADNCVDCGKNIRNLELLKINE